MPETPPPTANPTVASPKRSRPPGEMGGHTVMPWEQPESGQTTSHIPAGSDVASTASGGSSKSVPPPAAGAGRDGLGQGAGTSTATAADSSQHLEDAHPEGAEPRSRRVGRDEAPEDAMAGAQQTAFDATPQASKDAPEQQMEGGDATRPSPEPEQEDLELRHAPARETPGPLAERSGAVVSRPAPKPITPTAGATHPKPPPEAADATAKASTPKPGSIPKREAAPNPMVPSTGADAAKAASGAPIHPIDPAMATSSQHDPEEDRLVEALDRHLAEMLARALHETVATAVRETRIPPRPAAPPPVQPARK